jgi:hypothetical protein
MTGWRLEYSNMPFQARYAILHIFPDFFCGFDRQGFGREEDEMMGPPIPFPNHP